MAGQNRCVAEAGAAGAIMKNGVVYVAEIPTHHRSEHRTERGAIAVLKRAEAEHGIKGAVVAVETSGSYTSRTVVHPQPGPTRT